MSLIKKMFFLPLLCALFASIQISATEPYQPFFVGEHKSYFVGELGAKWQFPSDHLPRGISFGDLHIAFWNILNKNYLGHIQDNNQGLRDSAIMTDNVPVDNKSRLTVRELVSIEIILGMINHPTHPRSLIALEEVHGDVLNYLKNALPDHWAVITPPGQPSSQDLFIYDKDVFEYVGVKAVRYHDNLPKVIFTLLLKERSTGNSYRFLQSHVPGGPSSDDGCEKFANEAMKHYRTKETTVLMGDTNVSPTIMLKALQKASTEAGLDKQPFHYVSIDHPSHMNTYLEASWIDNFFVFTPKIAKRIHASHHAEEIHDSLEPIIDLFKIYRTQGQ